MGPMRATIADRLQESYRRAVHVTVGREIEVEGLVNTVEAAPADVSLIDGILVALSDVLETHPAFNATFEEGTHTLYEDQHIGIAMDIEDGLVTPVLRNLEAMSLEEIAAERRRLTGLVQDGDYSMSDLQGSTFTVSNLGPLGVDWFTPIINPPEIAILGITRLAETPVKHEGDIDFRPTIGFTLTFDHRVVDGAAAARFLDTLAEELE